MRETDPRFFAEPQLFGIYHAPGRLAAATGLPVLVCSSIGHEHTRSQRAVKLLCEALARAGHPALRFDYRGLGDSSGNSGDGGVAAWCEDIDHGLAELASSAGTRTAGVVGLRVGASLAVEALRRNSARCSHVKKLVLWDPVLRGEDFLQVGEALYSQFLSDRDRFPTLPRRRGSAPGQGPRDELLGYQYTQPIRQSLCSLDLSCLMPWPEVATAIVSSEPSSEYETLVARLGARGALADYQVADGVAAGWNVYELHEKTLRAGRVLPAIVARFAGQTV